MIDENTIAYAKKFFNTFNTANSMEEVCFEIVKYVKLISKNTNLQWKYEYKNNKLSLKFNFQELFDFTENIKDLRFMFSKTCTTMGIEKNKGFFKGNPFEFEIVTKTDGFNVHIHYSFNEEKLKEINSL